MSPKNTNTAKETKRRGKKEVDPDKPKKPLSAYFRFTLEKRDAVKAENPEFKVTEITKKLGDMWKELSEEDKAPYQKEYEKEKEEYDKKMEEYKKTHPSTKGDSDMPKKPVSPYILYANAHRAEVKEANPSLSVTEVAKKLGVMWNELDDSEKEEYKKQHDELKEKYDEELKAYYEKHPEAAKEKKEKQPKKQKKAKKEKEVVVSEEEEESEESENIFDKE